MPSRRNSQHAQAWLDLASLQQATGDLNAAAQSCTHVSNAIGVICSAGVAALTGRAEAAFTAIETVFVQRRIADQPVSVRIWAATLLAEIAERLGRHDDAEHWYRHSLSIDPTDAYTLAAYADFLLDRGRPAEVTKLIAADTTIDNLLLRRVQADHALDVESAQAGIAELAARFDALRERGDRVHRREESRFRLALAADADTALTLALDNWTVQKEPLDARIVLEAALATHRPQAARDVANAIVASGLQDGASDCFARRDAHAMNAPIRWIAGLLFALTLTPAFAHKPSDSHLVSAHRTRTHHRPLGHRAARSRRCVRSRSRPRRTHHVGKSARVAMRSTAMRSRGSAFRPTTPVR